MADNSETAGLTPSSSRNNTEKPARQHCNKLDGKLWLLNSISVWSDVEMQPGESYPEVPLALVERLIETFLPPDGHVILDPFSDSGTTLLATQQLGLQGIGRVSSTEHQKLVVPESVDLCIASPMDPRNLDREPKTSDDHEKFLTALADVFTDVLSALKAGAYCCIVVKDMRTKNRFLPVHSDLSSQLTKTGFVFHDLIIWDRGREYDGLRPLGYPTVFYLNRVHEYVLIMQKPRL